MKIGVLGPPYGAQRKLDEVGHGQICSILQHSNFEFFQKNTLRKFYFLFLPPICALKFVEMLLEGFSYALSITVVNLNIFNKI
jgi:hypothetical protein